MRFPAPLRAGVMLGGGAIALFCLASSARAQTDIHSLDAPSDRPIGIAAALQYAFSRAGNWNLIPVLSVGGGAGLWKAPADPHLLFLHYGLDLGVTGQPANRVALARSLLLPGVVSLRLGAGLGSTGTERTRFVFPDVSIGAKVVPWRDDTTAFHVGLSGGLGISSHDIFDASLRMTRAVNAFGIRDRKKFLAASESPDLWSSDFAATAGLHSRRGDIGIFGTFGAYLFDSKYHVPPEGRRVFSLGVRKAFG